MKSKAELLKKGELLNGVQTNEKYSKNSTPISLKTQSNIKLDVCSVKIPRYSPAKDEKALISKSTTSSELITPAMKLKSTTLIAPSADPSTSLSKSKLIISATKSKATLLTTSSSEPATKSKSLTVGPSTPATKLKATIVTTPSSEPAPTATKLKPTVGPSTPATKSKATVVTTPSSEPTTAIKSKPTIGPATPIQERKIYLSENDNLVKKTSASSQSLSTSELLRKVGTQNELLMSKDKIIEDLTCLNARLVDENTKLLGKMANLDKSFQDAVQLIQTMQRSSLEERQEQQAAAAACALHTAGLQQQVLDLTETLAQQQSTVAYTTATQDATAQTLYRLVTERLMDGIVSLEGDLAAVAPVIQAFDQEDQDEKVANGLAVSREQPEIGPTDHFQPSPASTRYPLSAFEDD